MAFEQRTVGRYKLLEQLGEGGMATAYLGLTEGADGFERKVVLKSMLPGAKQHISYFKAEAKILAQLHHENIVSVIDFFHAQEDGALYLVMEYVHGVELGALAVYIQKKYGRLPVPIALHIVRAIALGLHSAHEAKDKLGTPLLIVHRDVSPDNVILSREGLIKLIDFGVAKVTEAFRTETQAAGSLRGKFGYMSPEHLREKPLDRRADVYAVSLILWELLAGQRAFPVITSVEALAIKVMCGDIAQLRALAPGLPDALYSLVQRGVANKEDERITTAEELVIGLEQILPECSSRTVQRDLARLVVEAMAEAPSKTTPSPPQEAPSNVAAAPQAESTLRLPDESAEPDKSAEKVAPPSVEHSVAEPWKTTLLLNNPQPTDRPAVQHQPSSSAPAKRRGWPIVTAAAIGVVALGGLGVTLAHHTKVDAASRPANRSAVSVPPEPKRTDTMLPPRAQETVSVSPAATVPQPAKTVEPRFAEPKPRKDDHPRVASTVDPVTAAHLTERAEEEFNARHYKEAIVSASRALRFGAGERGYLVRGTAELELGKSRDAARDFKAVLKINPKSPDARDGLEAIKKMAVSEKTMGNIFIEGPAIDVMIDGKSVGKAPLTYKLPAGDHSYRAKITPINSTQSYFKLVAGETRRFYPALEIKLSDVRSAYMGGRFATAAEEAQKLIEMAKKAGCEGMVAAAYRFLGGADCHLGFKQAAMEALFFTTSDQHQFIVDECKHVGIQLQ